jgi:hypothetical protein
MGIIEECKEIIKAEKGETAAEEVVSPFLNISSYFTSTSKKKEVDEAEKWADGIKEEKEVYIL